MRSSAVRSVAVPAAPVAPVAPAAPAPVPPARVERLVLTTSRGAFAALAWGPEAAAGPPILWLHGFPDHPPTAAPFLAELARVTGRRVVAPWLRGYAPSPLAGPYDLDTLAADTLAMIDQLAGPAGRADLAGHDWGAAITYRACASAPARVRRAVAMALPHPTTFVHTELHSAAQRRASWYMALFQLPGAARLVRAHGLALVDRLWRAWSPRLVLDDDRRRALHACLAASLPAPLGYYRALVRPLATLHARLSRWPRIATPLLQLHGAEDGCVLPPSDEDAADAARFSARALEIVPNAGHFLHVEDPRTVAARVAAWLA